MKTIIMMNCFGVFFLVLGLTGSYLGESEMLRAACYVITNVWLAGAMLGTLILGD